LGDDVLILVGELQQVDSATRRLSGCGSSGMFLAILPKGGRPSPGGIGYVAGLAAFVTELVEFLAGLLCHRPDALQFGVRGCCRALRPESSADKDAEYVPAEHAVQHPFRHIACLS